MIKISGNKLNEFETDAIKEVGNIGSGNASTKLSEIVNERVNLELTEIKIINTKDLINAYEINKEDNNPVVSVFLRVEGDAIGSVITLFEKDFATKIADLIDKKPIGTTNAITSECESKFKSIGIALGESYINSLIEFLSINLNYKDPIVQINKKNIIMKFMLQGISPYVAEDVLILQTKFNVAKYEIKGEFMILFGLKSIENFKTAIKKILGQ